MRELATALDTALIQVSRVLNEPLFYSYVDHLGDGYELPLLLRDKEEKRQGGVPSFALLEAAYYDNTDASKTENCAAHYDPGLFSLNVLSNEAGLEFQDCNGAWMAAPYGDYALGILWGREGLHSSGCASSFYFHSFISSSSSSFHLE